MFGVQNYFVLSDRKALCAVCVCLGRNCLLGCWYQNLENLCIICMVVEFVELVCWRSEFMCWQDFAVGKDNVLKNYKNSIKSKYMLRFINEKCFDLQAD